MQRRDNPKVQFLFCLRRLPRFARAAGIPTGELNETYTKKALIKVVKKKLDDVQVMSYNYPIEDNKDEELIEKMKSYFGMILKRAEVFPEFAELKKEAEEIKQYIDEHGYEPATFIYMIAKKK